MPLDHYVSQTHLRQFVSPSLPNRFYATRKQDLKTYPADSASQCRVQNGSTNRYLSEPRAIEEFLKTVEPAYAAVVSCLEQRSIDNECVYVVASFVAYVQSCSPAGMRIATAPLETVVETTARMMDAHGQFPPPPPALEGASITELLDTGRIKVTADRKYPQAIGISGILEIVKTIGNFSWEILLNTHENSPFFTSDYPVALEKTKDPRIIHKIVPLSPFVAVRMIPCLEPRSTDVDELSFPHFRCRFLSPSKAEVGHINRLIVQCAETTVYYRETMPWVLPFIEKNRLFRIESQTLQFPTGRGVLHLTTQQIAPYTYEPEREQA